MSALSPTPSLSESKVSKGLKGKTSNASSTPSLSASRSALSPIPSSSLSLLSLNSKGKASSKNCSPSPSGSKSISGISRRPSRVEPQHTRPVSSITQADEEPMSTCLGLITSGKSEKLPLKLPQHFRP